MTTTRLTCHAPHPDRRRTDEECGTPLADFPAAGVRYEFIGISRMAPPVIDGYARASCKRCGWWNRFRILRLARRRATA